MSRFYLLDHSLRKSGGHHLEYAVHTLTAADELGFEVILASHRKFAERERLQADWRLIPAFSFTTYQRYAIHESSRGRTAAGGLRRILNAAAAVTDPLQRVWRAADRRRRIRSFANACERVFRSTPVQRGDQVFVPTLSEFDLLGLVEFMKRDERSQLADWHLQFHFNVFQGREPEYAAQQERENLIRDRLQAPLNEIRQHRVHLYTTCDMLARQFNRLGVGKFHALAYPIDPAIADAPTADNSQTSEQPLRVTVAGAIRKEKGHQHLQSVLEELRQKLGQRIRLVVQSNKSWFRLDKAEADSETSLAAEVEYVPHPLGPEQYANLIRDADIGLLLYDSRRYYARRAGILGEYLAAGKPVIVPAGCWLAEQLVESSRQHLERLLTTERNATVAESTSATTGAEASWHGVQPSAGDGLMVRFQWDDDTTPGSYVRVQLQQSDEQGNVLACEPQIVGHRASGAVSLLFNLKPEARFVQTSFSNPYDERTLNLYDVRLQHLHSPDGRTFPRSAVGVVFADESCVANCTQELAEHFEHYQRTAQQFAAQWMDAHQPTRTVAQLIQQSQAGRSAEPTEPRVMARVA